MSPRENGRVTIAGTILIAAAFTYVAQSGPAAETGDFDGDGRITLADVLFFGPNAPAPADGSLDGYRADVCFGRLRGVVGDPSIEWLGMWAIVASNCFLEWVRRAVPGSLVPWDTIADFHVSQLPFPADSRVVVRVVDAVSPAGAEDRVPLVLWVESAEAFRGFALVLEADAGVFGAPHWAEPEPWYASRAWRDRGAFFRPTMVGGDLDVSLSIPAYLVSRGRYVVSYGLRRSTIELLPPGAYMLAVEARIPLGTKAGTYALRVLPSSEVVLGDGTVVAPLVEGEASLTVERDVTAGWGEGPVPLRVEPERREVLGAIEFRLAAPSGDPLEVVAEGAPGDPVAVLIQMRTEVPLNHIRCGFVWPAEGLLCEGSWPENPEIVFRNPEDGLLYPPAAGSNYCSDAITGATRVEFQLAGDADYEATLGRFEGRVLEYFKPLGIWTDLALVRLRISPFATPGSEIRLVCGTMCAGWFTPYNLGYPCESTLSYWSYSGTGATGARIRVIEGPPPPPPPDYEIRFRLGDVAGRAGEVLAVPFFASASAPLAKLRLALELDPEVARVETVDIVVTSRLTGEQRTETVPRGNTGIFSECVDRDGDGVKETCEDGQPGTAFFYSAEQRYVLIDLFSGGEDDPYPGVTPRLLGRVRVRIADEPMAAETALVPASVPHTEGGIPAKASSGGWKFPLEPGARFSPLKGFEGGRIRVEGFVPKKFLRGDANGDRKVDISDAIATLGYLFLGLPEPECLDAADIDDSGYLDITDGIFLLGVLFLGAGTVPEPYPECGEDPTPDGLGCCRGCGAG